eukprot:jgi/Astpho2/6346/Aster-06011
MDRSIQQHAASLPAQPCAGQGLQGGSTSQPQRQQMSPQTRKCMFLVVCRPLVQVQVSLASSSAASTAAVVYQHRAGTWKLGRCLYLASNSAA